MPNALTCGANTSIRAISPCGNQVVQPMPPCDIKKDSCVGYTHHIALILAENCGMPNCNSRACRGETSSRKASSPPLQWGKASPIDTGPICGKPTSARTMDSRGVQRVEWTAPCPLSKGQCTGETHHTALKLADN